MGEFNSTVENLNKNWRELNLAVDTVRGKDLVGEIEGEDEEFRNRDVKRNASMSTKLLKLTRSKKMKKD